MSFLGLDEARELGLAAEPTACSAAGLEFLNSQFRISEFRKIRSNSSRHQSTWLRYYTAARVSPFIAGRV